MNVNGVHPKDFIHRSRPEDRAHRYPVECRYGGAQDWWHEEATTAGAGYVGVTTGGQESYGGRDYSTEVGVGNAGGTTEFNAYGVLPPRSLRLKVDWWAQIGRAADNMVDADWDYMSFLTCGQPVDNANSMIAGVKLVCTLGVDLDVQLHYDGVWNNQIFMPWPSAAQPNIIHICYLLDFTQGVYQGAWLNGSWCINSDGRPISYINAALPSQIGTVYSRYKLSCANTGDMNVARIVDHTVEAIT